MMEVAPDTTLREARDLFYAAHEFPQDGGVTRAKWSPIGCRDLKVYLPNFKWRRKAIPFHDLHHIVADYEFCPTGEFQVAAWEFAAGKYPNIFTTLFCIPLVSMGALSIPKKQFRAFVRGRRSRTLYGNYDYETLLNKTLGEIRREILPEKKNKVGFDDYFEYAKLVFLSAMVIATPLLLMVLMFLIFVGVR